MFGFFQKKHSILLSPEVHGKVMLDARPLVNITVYRELFYEKRFLEETRTDSNGSFYFPERITRSNAPGKLFGETHVTQLIAAEVDSQMYILWSTSTTNIHGPATIREKLSQLICDINNPEVLTHLENQETPQFTHNVTTICRW